MKKVLTLVFILSEGKVLLGLKKRGFGMGLWNGFGGKVKPYELIVEAAKREVLEECGLHVLDPEELAVIEFEFEDSIDQLEVHVFLVTQFVGKVVESSEMEPRWFEVAVIPFESMWVDDQLWLGYILARKKFKAKFVLRGTDTILEQKIVFE